MKCQKKFQNVIKSKYGVLDMGNTCCTGRKTKKKIVLLLLGLDNAGKTVAAKGLAGESIETVVPTVGFSVISLPFRDFTVKVFDLGGGPGIRGIWPRYFVDAHGIIFVIDASDATRLDEVKAALGDILSHEKVIGKPILILANKQDRDNALDEIDLVERLDLEVMVNEHQCPTLIESCSATEGTSKSRLDPGIKKGYHWILSYIHRHYNNLNYRVEVDVRQQEVMEKHLRDETIKKLKSLEPKDQKTEDEDAIESYSDYNRKLNGAARTFDESEIQNHDLVLQSSFANSGSDLSSGSTESFPPVYFGTIDNEFIETEKRRPKSATQFVSNQLKLEQTQISLPFRTLVANKTDPVNLLGERSLRSAGERRSDFTIHRRNLRSAGDSVYVTTDLPNIVMEGPDGDLDRELYEWRSSKWVRRKQGAGDSENGLPWTHKPLDKSAISVVDIE